MRVQNVHPHSSARSAHTGFELFAPLVNGCIDGALLKPPPQSGRFTRWCRPSVSPFVCSFVCRLCRVGSGSHQGCPMCFSLVKTSPMKFWLRRGLTRGVHKRTHLFNARCAKHFAGAVAEYLPPPAQRDVMFCVSLRSVVWFSTRRLLNRMRYHNEIFTGARFGQRRTSSKMAAFRCTAARGWWL